MKLKNLLAVALMVIGSSAWAQDVWKDVTSTYLTNTDLNGDYTSLSKINSTTLNSRTFQQPKGWSLYVSSANSNDASFLTSNDNASSYTSNIASQITLPANTEVDGDRKLVVRINNSGSNRRFELYQQVTLPIGTYKISGQFNNKNTGYMRTGVYYKSSDDANQRAQVGSNNTKDQWVTVEKTFTMSKEESISVGFYFTQLNANGWGIAAANDIKLEFNLTKALASKIAEANSTKIVGDQSKYGTALQELIDNADNVKDSQNESDLETAINNLSNAISTYNEKVAIINSLINVRKEIARAEAYSVVNTDNATSYANAIQAAKDVINEDNDVDYSNEILAMQNFKVEDYTWVNETYTEHYTGFNSNSMNIGMQDASDNKYGNNSGNYRNLWMNYAYDCGVNGKVTLPAGDYVLKCIGRASVENLLYLQVKIGDNEATKVYYDGKGSLGIGVNTDGEACFDTNGNTFANDNRGYGWEWRFITFHLDESAQVELGAKAKIDNTWVSVYNPVLYMTQATKDAIDLAAARKNLKDVIDAAPSHATNVGNGAFQIPTNAANTYNTAKIAAQSAHDAQDATLASLADAKSTFEAAITTFNAATLNAPADGKKYNFTLGGSNSWADKAITYIAGGRNDHGGYSISYETEPNSNYAQAFTMTQVAGNQYKMSQTDADGNERYICTALGGYETGSHYQIRTTTDVEKALVVEIVPTNVEGVYNIKNTVANANIGSKDNGVYTNDGNGSYVVDFTIAEASKASANFVITPAKYGTFIAPFNAEKPANVTLYTCAAVENDVLTLEEANAVVANTPYIVYSESEVNDNLEGWGLATTATYKKGLLTGVYTLTPAEDGWYILQNHDDEGVGFYQVDTNTATPNVPANRCYLTVGGGANVRAFFFDGETAISAIEALTSGKAEIYNLNGVKLNSLQKGINIVNGRKVLVK